MDLRRMTDEGRRQRLLLLSLYAAPVATGPTYVDIAAPSGSATLASLGIGGNGLCTILVEATCTSVATGAVQAFAVVDAGSVSNVIYARTAAATAAFQVSRSTAGANATTATGTVSAGVAFKFGLAITGDGTAYVSLDGATAASVSGGPTSGLTTLRWGALSNGGLPITGSFARARVYPGIAYSDAALPGLVTGY